MPSEASLANLRPWQPGQSGSPGFQPKGYRRVLHLARKNSPEAMQTIVDLLHDPDPRVRLTAATAILERAWGKPKEHLQLGGAEGANVLVVTGVPRSDEVSLEQLADAQVTIEYTAEDEAP